MDKKIVLIVGAGGTRADIDEDAERKPPLDKGFFKQAHGVDPGSFNVVDSYCRTHYAINVLADGEDSMEGVFSTIYSDCYRPDVKGLQAYQALRALVNLLILELKETTNPLPASPHNFVYKFVRSQLMRGIKVEDITIITFNYDLHIERTLELLAQKERNRRVFQFPTCYRVEYDKCTSPRYVPGKNSLFAVSRGTTGLRVLKLHGSLNWYSTYDDLDIPQEVLFDPERRLNITRRKIIEPFMHIADDKVAFPVVIPPVIHKAGVLPDVLKPVWTSAEESIKEADETYVLGYSCPQTDVESANMLRRAFRGIDRPSRELHLIDPNPSVVTRYAGLTGARSMHYYTDGVSFLVSWAFEKVPGAIPQIIEMQPAFKRSVEEQKASVQ